MRSEHSWSLIDPRPVLLYLPNLDEYIVYWNGIATTHTMAMNIAMEYFGIYPTPEMKTAMERNYQTVYYSNGFGTRAWDLKVCDSPIYPYTKRMLKNHCDAQISDKKLEINEVLDWFCYNRSRRLDTE
jgi:hypothetical protein